jgi:glucose-1-phosphate adenylyltransferase
MDPRQMVEQHIESKAAVTVAGIRVPRAEASSFGIIDADENGKIKAFLEKPEDPPGLPDSPDESYASMGNYVFTTESLIESLRTDAGDEASVHDMGGSIIPMLTKEGTARVYDFADNDVPGATDRDRGYWRDVGTIDAYYDANMDLVAVHPVFNLYNRQWPIFTDTPQLPAAKFVEGGLSQESIVAHGSILAGSTVRHSVVFPGVTVLQGAYVEGSVLLPGTRIEAGTVVRRAILDKNVQVPAGAHIGVDPEMDRQRYHVSDGGVVVLGKGELAQP